MIFQPYGPVEGKGQFFQSSSLAGRRDTPLCKDVISQIWLSHQRAPSLSFFFPFFCGGNGEGGEGEGI